MSEIERALTTVIHLVRRLQPTMLNVGHGRDRTSVEHARAFVEAWTALGGDVGAVVSWPATAASWLRPARRLSTGADTWVVADTPTGWAGIGPRLVETGRWRPDRTIAFPGLADPALAHLAGRHATDGLRGAATTGHVYEHTGGWLRTLDRVTTR